MNNKRQLYRSVLDNADVTADAIASYLVEEMLGSKAYRKSGEDLSERHLLELTTHTSSLIKDKANEFVDRLMKAEG